MGTYLEGGLECFYHWVTRIPNKRPILPDHGIYFGLPLSPALGLGKPRVWVWVTQGPFEGTIGRQRARYPCANK